MKKIKPQKNKSQTSLPTVYLKFAEFHYAQRKNQKTLEKERNILFAYIFGSYARGEARENSDIDLAIYVKRVPKDIFKYESKIASKIEKEIKNKRKLEF